MLSLWVLEQVACGSKTSNGLQRCSVCATRALGVEQEALAGRKNSSPARYCHQCDCRKCVRSIIVAWPIAGLLCCISAARWRMGGGRGGMGEALMDSTPLLPSNCVLVASAGLALVISAW